MKGEPMTLPAPAGEPLSAPTDLASTDLAPAVRPDGGHLADGFLADGPTASLVQSVDWLAIAPPTLTAVLALVLLVADLFLPARRKPLLGGIAVAGLLLAGLTLLPLHEGDRATFCLASGTGTGGGVAGSCSYVADPFTLVIQLLVLGGALLTALLSVPVLRRTALPEGEYWFLLLASAAGATLLPASRDLITLVIALEVASLPAFALVGLRRGDRLSAESAWKFFLSSVTATAVTLLGVSFVYGATGAVHLEAVAEGLKRVDGGPLHSLATLGVGLTLVGFAFKTAAVPFHFWVPDTYVGAPLPVAGYLSVVSKAVGFSGLALVTVVAFPSAADLWGPAVAVLAALTMTVGNVAALRQRPDGPHSAVRLLAWSSVGQAGYLLVPIAAAGYAADPSRAVGATVAYALMYAVVNLGVFGVVTLVAGGGSPSPRIADHRGLYARHPLAALALAFFLLCLAGLPPGVIGLFAKVTVFAAAVDGGLGWLAVVMALNVVIALSYYLSWTAVLFRGPTEPATPAPSAGPSSAASATPSPSGAAEPAGAAGAPGSSGSAPAGSDTRTPVPSSAAASGPLAAARSLPGGLPLTVAVALAALTALALSAAPQLVLRFASQGLL